MNRLRFPLLALAVFTGSYAAVSWVYGFLTDAGVAGAICAALVCWFGAIDYAARRRERLREARTDVWTRRDRQVRR